MIAAFGEGKGCMFGLGLDVGLTVVHDPDVEGAAKDPLPVDLPILLFVWMRARSGEKWIELNAGLSRVGVGVADVIFVEIWEGDAENDPTPAGRIGRFF